MNSPNNSNTPLLVRALRGEAVETVPLWYMRQAGRYLPEYQEIRTGRTFLDLSENPDLAVEISLQPYHRFAPDGIIMFSDILTPIKAAGIPLHFEESKGPVLDRTIRSESELRLIDSFDAARDTAHVTEILTRLRAHIDGIEQDRPALLGFAGAPFTLASYIVEGGTSKRFEKTKAAVFGQSAFFHKLSERLCEITVEYLAMQLETGADAVQIFDSWGGILSPADYAEFSAPYTAKIIAALRKRSDKPIILFVGNSAHLLREMIAQEPNVLSLDWRVRAEDVLELAPAQMALQGNLDPLTLYGDPERVRAATQAVLHNYGKRRGYVFNLGHGIHPQTPIENVQAMIDTVRGFAVS